ncbi:MAG: hypothetical protein IBX39_08285 [Candidatus Methanoperedenaceae archaeon]|nr:hypothetical protein [Candidatus Methanoperedenaceae archaeon]
MDKTQKLGKTIRMDIVHWEIINGLTPFYGSTEAEVVRNIVLVWLNENIGNDTIKKLQDMKVIKLDEIKVN